MQNLEDVKKLLGFKKSVAIYDDETLTAEWVPYKYIMKAYSISRSTVARRCKAMQGMKRYENSFIRLNHQSLLVNLEDFHEFMTTDGFYSSMSEVQQ